MYVPVVTLSKENDIKLLEQLKSGFKRTIKWNKYRSQMTIQPQNNNLNYLIDPTFTNVNRLFVLSFPRNNNTDSRYSFSNYYVPKVEINNFNVLIDGKSFFDFPVKNEKNEEEAYKKIIGDNDYTTGNLLDYAYYKKHYKLIEKSEKATFDFSQNSVTIVWIMVTQKIVNLLNGFDNDNSEIIVKRRNAADTADVALGAITQVAIS